METMIDTMTIECEAKTAKTVSSIDKRLDEYRQIKVTLEEQLDEASNTIAKADDWINKLRKREIFGDPNQLDGVARNGKELEDAEAVRNLLKESKQDLENNLRRKNHCIQIDQQCRNMRPVRVDTRSAEDRNMFQNAGKKGNATSVPSSPGAKMARSASDGMFNKTA